MSNSAVDESRRERRRWTCLLFLPVVLSVVLLVGRSALHVRDGLMLTVGIAAVGGVPALVALGLREPQWKTVAYAGLALTFFAALPPLRYCGSEPTPGLAPFLTGMLSALSGLFILPLSAKKWRTEIGIAAFLSAAVMAQLDIISLFCHFTLW